MGPGTTQKLGDVRGIGIQVRVRVRASVGQVQDDRANQETMDGHNLQKNKMQRSQVGTILSGNNMR